jgi:hypothetical protein
VLLSRMGCSQRPEDGTGMYVMSTLITSLIIAAACRAITQSQLDWAMQMHNKTLGFA